MYSHGAVLLQPLAVCCPGELLVGPKKTLFLDEISTGLDSSTTFQITRTLRDFSHLRQATMLVALLQPTPETYNLFDDILLMSEGERLHLCSCTTTADVAVHVQACLSIAFSQHNVQHRMMLRC